VKPAWGVGQVDQEGQPLGLELGAEIPAPPVPELEAAEGPKLDHGSPMECRRGRPPGEITDY